MENSKRNPTPPDSRRGTKPERDLSSSFAEQDRREQRNMDDRNQEPPEPRDPENPASKPQGTTEDQVANMESEGQAQERVDPEDKNPSGTAPPDRQKEKRGTHRG